MGPERTTPPGLQIDNLPFIDVVVISHNHYDHLDSQSIKSLIKRQQNNQPVFFVPLKLKKTLQNLALQTLLSMSGGNPQNTNN
jgi:N-acyl-phosphatidylethanolamine-hydrolysing phospholipase D